MTEQKRPTLIGLNATVERLAADVEAIKQPKVDFEASVAGRCATALDNLQKSAEPGRNSTTGYASLSPSWQNDSNSYGTVYHYQPTFIPPFGPVARVLDYLRQRYGLPDPTLEARRLSAELERAYGRMRELEQRLEQIRGAPLHRSPGAMRFGALCFAGGFVLLAVVTVAVGDRINRHVQRALGNGDAQVRAFVAEVEAWDAEQTALARRVR